MWSLRGYSRTLLMTYSKADRHLIWGHILWATIQCIHVIFYVTHPYHGIRMAFPFLYAPIFPKTEMIHSSSILYKLSFRYFRGNLYFYFSEFARSTSRRFNKNSASTRWDGQSNWFYRYVHLWKFERKTGYWCKKWNIKTRTD